MRKFLSGSPLLFVILVLLFLLFSTWYDGWWVSPLTAKEGEALYKALSGQHSDAQKSKLNRKSVLTFAGTDDGKAFYMLNLMKFKKSTQYQNGEKSGGSSIDASNRYTRAVMLLLLQRGSHPVLAATPLHTFSLPTISEKWDVMVLVRYRSRRDFYEMVKSKAFQKAYVHKLASIDKTVVIPCRPMIPGINLKWLFGMLLLVIGWVGHKLIQRRRNTTQMSKEAQ